MNFNMNTNLGEATNVQLRGQMPHVGGVQMNSNMNHFGHMGEKELSYWDQFKHPQNYSHFLWFNSQSREEVLSKIQSCEGEQQLENWIAFYWKRIHIMTKCLLKTFVLFPIYVFFLLFQIFIFWCVFLILFGIWGPILSIYYTVYFVYRHKSRLGRVYALVCCPVVTLCVGVSQAYERSFLKSWECICGNPRETARVLFCW